MSPQELNVMLQRIKKLPKAHLKRVVKIGLREICRRDRSRVVIIRTVQERKLLEGIGEGE